MYAGRFLSYLVAVGSTGNILKLACRCFLLWYHKQCSLGVGGTSGSVGDTSGDVSSQKM